MLLSLTGNPLKVVISCGVGSFDVEVRIAADTALRLAGQCLWPWVPENDRRRFLADALPLVGALPPSSPASAFASSELSEQPGPTSSLEDDVRTYD